jgi:hypothetical protein
MTIHRAFRLLDKQAVYAPDIEQLFGCLTERFALTIITTNWDIMAERCLERYGIDIMYESTSDIRRPARLQVKTPVWKIRGPRNWAYCDLCRNLITSHLDLGKITVKSELPLEADDCELFRGGAKFASKLDHAAGLPIVRLPRRSATASTSSPRFHSKWDSARSQADRRLLQDTLCPRRISKLGNCSRPQNSQFRTKEGHG